MLVQCFLRRGLVYIPTSGMVDRGLYYDVEPVAVVATLDTDALRHAFVETIARGNPRVAAIKRPDHPPPILLKYAGLKNWNTFAREASLWEIEERNEIFRIETYRKDPPGGWTRDEDKDETFPPGTTAAPVIERMIAILQTAAAQAPSK
jgi:hypothetical protein